MYVRSFLFVQCEIREWWYAGETRAQIWGQRLARTGWLLLSLYGGAVIKGKSIRSSHPGKRRSGCDAENILQQRLQLHVDKFSLWTDTLKPRGRIQRSKRSICRWCCFRCQLFGWKERAWISRFTRGRGRGEQRVICRWIGATRRRRPRQWGVPIPMDVRKLRWWPVR